MADHYNDIAETSRDPCTRAVSLRKLASVIEIPYSLMVWHKVFIPDVGSWHATRSCMIYMLIN